MTTEAEIIYAIWEIVRGGETNQDDPINERLMRAFLRIHRGKILSKYYSDGAEIPDQCFQFLGPIEFTMREDRLLISPQIPNIIRFKENYGFMVDIDGFYISVVNTDSWHNARKDRFNKYHPLIKFMNSYMIMYPGKNQPDLLEDFSNTALNTVVNMLNQLTTNGVVPVNIQAILVNPDDEPNYNFTTSPYPLPDELIEDLINSVNAREFNLFLRVKSDEISNLRNDTKPQDTSKEH